MTTVKDLIDNDDDIEKTAEEIEEQKEQQRLEERRSNTKYGSKRTSE